MARLSVDVSRRHDARSEIGSESPRRLKLDLVQDASAVRPSIRSEDDVSVNKGLEHRGPGRVRPVGGPSFIHALHCFSGLPQVEIEALYAVRCALAHDYSLFNVNTPDRTHVFTYDDTEDVPIVQLRQTAWTGDYRAIAQDQVTTVNLRAVGDLVEEIVERLRGLLASDELVLRIPLDEFRTRYFMTYQVH